MKYALLIHDNEAEYAKRSPAEQEQDMADYYAFGERHKDVIGGGEALHPVATATTVRVRDGERLLTDGPFAETREQFGGFYVVDVPDLDAALALAAEIPGASTGCVEVRAVFDFEAQA